MDTRRLVPPLRVFLSYSHHDADLFDEFLRHLGQLRREGRIELCHGRCIDLGTEWVGAINEQINSANIIILLVSSDFLASDYCNDVEMARALERSQKGEARLVPVIL